MEELQMYLSGDGYCAICLRGPGEARLARTTDEDFFAAIQVHQVTRYLCGWCRRRLSGFHELKTRALRSQYWLYNVHHSQSFAEANQQNLLSELAAIKKDCLKTDTPLTASVYLSGFTVLVKSDPERGDVDAGGATRAEIKIDLDVGSWEEWKASDDTEQKSTDPSDDLIQNSQLLREVNPSDNFPNSELKLTARGNRKKRKSRYQDNLRRTLKINEASGKVVLDELDDVGYMLADVMKQKVLPIMLPEQEYWRLHRERLNKTQYTGLPYKCANCALGFQKKTLYEKHMARHSPSLGPYTCHMCSTRYKTPTELSIHAAAHLRRYSCRECSHTGYNRQDVTNHYFAEHTLLRFHCRHCDLQTKGPFLVKEHILTKHQRRHDKEEECPICKKMIKHRSKIRHAKSHEIILPVRCGVCGREFKHEISLRQHARKFHVEQPESLEECPVCKKTIASSARAAHVRTHSEAAYCADCGKSFTNKYGLRVHRDRLHGRTRQRFQCDECGVFYATKAAVRRHILFVHMKIGGVGCHICGRMFSHVGEMHSHVRHVHEKHLAPRDKLCDICGKGFTTHKILENHRLIHTGEKPHACSVCGQTFRQPSAMHTHVKLKHLKMKMKDIASRRRQRHEDKRRASVDGAYRLLYQ